MLALSLVDFSSLGLPAWIHISAGVGLFAAGGSFGWMGFRTLGPEISTGIPGDLQVRGPYRISRNPQYVGAVGVLSGLALLSNSLTVLLAAVPWCLWFWLAPLAEEPWLQVLLGDPYISYAAKTKRYL
jgi:protein-S-isoprenylcysteine O-methyltransferase Ste14